ncbi:MAG: flagellar M-ring protein FliF, partial [Deferribacterales bacterium]|nr:flagellar M-ring protein FliF [Deferribacterales bacterium]
MTFRNISGQFLDIWAKLTMLQRVSIGAATVAVFAAIAVLIIWANRPAYKTLYADMAEEDLREVSENLKQKSIDHKVTGNAIEVLPDQVYDTRIMLA